VLSELWPSVLERLKQVVERDRENKTAGPEPTGGKW